MGNSTKRAWIGLYCFENDPEKCSWDSEYGNAKEYNNFAPNFPYIEMDKCVYLKSSGKLAGKWLSGDCQEDQRSFVCEIPTTFEADCELNFNGNCYFPSVNKSIGFENARISCETHCGDLVSIHSAAEISFIKNYYKNHMDVDSIYIGTRANHWPGHYHRWVDDSKVDYTNFDVSEKKCLTMSLKTTETKAAGFWYGTDCLATEHFLCKRPIGKDCESTPSTVAPLEYKEHYTFLLKSGSFSSPNYPENYTAISTSVYSLATFGSQKIRLTFNDILTEYHYDYILIYDGDSIESPLIGNISGIHHEKNIFESSTNNLYVIFITDISVNKLGFTASFQSII
ncbi:hypothetical protein B9Z55_004520 [Caenorhabditis nigoni]|nr:hypothetical protein B9Z55_004520 [Caenorhabditis nigoni]